LDRLYPITGGVLWVRSGGDSLWFADNGSGGYQRPVGDEIFSTLVKNADQTFTLTDKHGIKTNFSSAGLLTSRVDRNNNTISYTHSSGLLTQIADPFGRNTNLTYTGGRLTSVTDFAGRTATLAYDGSGRLTSVTQPNPGGGAATPVWTFSYDASTHQLTGRTNPLNQTTQFQYGTSHGRLTRVTHPDNATWQLVALQSLGMPTGTSGNTLTSANPLGTVTDERGKQSTFRTDRFGRLSEWNNPLSHKTLWERNHDGLVARLTEADPDGTGELVSPVTTLGYDLLGNLKYQRNPDASTLTWTYTSSYNLPATAVDELARTHSFSYDSLGNLTSITDPAGYATSLTYSNCKS
jgi:YD repeat-containing protein